MLFFYCYRSCVRKHARLFDHLLENTTSNSDHVLIQNYTTLNQNTQYLRSQLKAHFVLSGIISIRMDRLLILAFNTTANISARHGSFTSVLTSCCEKHGKITMADATAAPPPLDAPLTYRRDIAQQIHLHHNASCVPSTRHIHIDCTS